MGAHSVYWKHVLTYAPMSNDCAEQMVGTIKAICRRLVAGTEKGWGEELIKAING